MGKWRLSLLNIIHGEVEDIFERSQIVNWLTILITEAHIFAEICIFILSYR